MPSGFTLVMDREDLAGAAEARLHLVHDHEDVVLAADALHLGE